MDSFFSVKFSVFTFWTLVWFSARVWGPTVPLLMVSQQGAKIVYDKCILPFFQNNSERIDKTVEMMRAIFESRVAGMARNMMNIVVHKSQEIFKQVEKDVLGALQPCNCSIVVTWTFAYPCISFLMQGMSCLSKLTYSLLVKKNEGSPAVETPSAATVDANAQQKSK